MDLTGIISISGKPGLYKVVAQSPKNIIVENLVDGKKAPAFASHKISALEDITMYTQEGDDKPLKEVYSDLFQHLDGKEAPSHKEEMNVLRGLFDTVMPDNDKEMIFDSDVRKMFQWYNILVTSGTLEERLKASEENTEENPSEEEE